MDRVLRIPGPFGIPLALGTWQFDESDWEPITTRAAKSILACAWELGFRHFDGAERYGNGRAEQLIGQALRTQLRNDRESVQIATKSVVRPPAQLAKHLERSLRRLGIDSVDLYYIHWPREGLDLRAAVEELARQRERGRISSIGLSNVTPSQLARARSVTTIDAVQLGYNLIWRRIERERSEWNGAPALIAYSPLCQGLLARPFPTEPAWHASDHRRGTPLFRPPTWEHTRRFGSEMVALCRRAGFEPAAVALRWVVHRADAAVVGARSPRQLEALHRGLDGIRRESTALDSLLDELTDRSDALQRYLPELPNIFGYVPTPCDRPDSALHR